MQVNIRGKKFTVRRLRGKPIGVYASGTLPEIEECHDILTESGMLDIQEEQVTDNQWCITAVYSVEGCPS